MVHAVIEYLNVTQVIDENVFRLQIMNGEAKFIQTCHSVGDLMEDSQNIVVATVHLFIQRLANVLRYNNRPFCPMKIAKPLKIGELNFDVLIYHVLTE